MTSVAGEKGGAHGRRAVTLAMVVGLTAAVLSGCSTRMEIAESVPDDEEFTARLDALGEAYETLDIQEVLNRYANDDYSVSGEVPIEFATGKLEHREILAAVLGNLGSMTIAWAPELKAWKNDTRAWTNRSFTATGELKDGRAYVYRGRHSAVWEKRGDEWVIWYEHFVGHPEVEQPPAPPPAPTPEPTPAPPPPPRLADIFFDLDRSEIRADQVPTLEENLRILIDNPAMRVRIEGHCDVRATEEYNVALGQRRADATKRWLVEHGVDAARIEAVSVGEGEEYAAGSGEPAWGLNRRSHFVILTR